MRLHSEALQRLYDCAQLAVNFSGLQASDDNEVVMLRDALKDAKTALAALAGGGEAVAWLWSNGSFLKCVPKDFPNAFPVFTHPAGAAQVTDEAMVRDASYFRWLTGDHTDREEREAVRRILESMGTRSYSGTLLDIEGTLRDLGYDTAAINPGGSRDHD